MERYVYRAVSPAGLVEVQLLLHLHKQRTTWTEVMAHYLSASAELFRAGHQHTMHKTNRARMTLNKQCRNCATAVGLIVTKLSVTGLL